MKFHVGGTMVAAGLAMQYGWAINIGGERDTPLGVYVDASNHIQHASLTVRSPAIWIHSCALIRATQNPPHSGGMHHAHASTGMGWCPFADITLAVQRLRQASGGAVRKARDDICRGEGDRINTHHLSTCVHSLSILISTLTLSLDPHSSLTRVLSGPLH